MQHYIQKFDRNWGGLLLQQRKIVIKAYLVGRPDSGSHGYWHVQIIFEMEFVFYKLLYKVAML